MYETKLNVSLFEQINLFASKFTLFAPENIFRGLKVLFVQLFRASEISKCEKRDFMLFYSIRPYFWALQFVSSPHLVYTSR